MARKVCLDSDACIACGFCYDSVPDVFGSDDEGTAFVANPDGADEASIQDAIDGCPAACIFWEET
ncbi:ferredoxin [Desulfurispirillum indicum]|uniref:Ferredoxin n=1 Tax=Desulfurispirillum indicum (strain ATCC BAA-1389 / DSM 22839 / S5) TaxID=653733 RepID=E6W2C8_DESIS|nr:ferredoxin [Desulfurispirillum indicum]ADU65586.1 ferredoxin-2 [Desulfurispirillum indicum S5]UCZ57582.1 ferredoxin [Desulfurispirillum indicum]